MNLENAIMADDSTFREVIDFFDKLGIYDVVLPFLLVFTIVFAILDKTRVLGTEKIDNVDYPKKNLNAIVAFVIGFMVVASSQLVEAITDISANMVILLLLSVFFLLLVGSFFKEGEAVFLDDNWKKFFMVIMFVVLVLIFLQAIKTDDGDGDSWLEYAWDWMDEHWDSNAVASIILVLVIIFFMWLVVNPKEASSKKKIKKDENE